jgi:hypothetical protein
MDYLNSKWSEEKSAGFDFNPAVLPGNPAVNLTGVQKMNN